MAEGTVPELTNVELELLTEAAVQQLQLLAALQQLLHKRRCVLHDFACDSTATLKLSHELNNYFEDLKYQCLLPSVANPDPYVFGLLGSGSFYHQAKIERKTLVPTVL
jgi:hypothetical protein